MRKKKNILLFWRVRPHSIPPWILVSRLVFPFSEISWWLWCKIMQIKYVIYYCEVIRVAPLRKNIILRNSFFKNYPRRRNVPEIIFYKLRQTRLYSIAFTLKTEYFQIINKVMKRKVTVNLFIKKNFYFGSQFFTMPIYFSENASNVANSEAVMCFFLLAKNGGFKWGWNLVSVTVHRSALSFAHKIKS